MSVIPEEEIRAISNITIALSVEGHTCSSCLHFDNSHQMEYGLNRSYPAPGYVAVAWPDRKALR